jgi:hypothetical protein
LVIDVDGAPEITQLLVSDTQIAEGAPFCIAPIKSSGSSEHGFQQANALTGI